MSDSRIPIGKVAARTGCKVETIRFYEREGLLPPPQRTDGGHRLYTSAGVHRLVFIRRCRELGFSMDQVRLLLSLVDRDQVSCERVKEIAEAHLLDIRAKITDLRSMESTLEALAERCSGDDVPDCPIIDVLQRA